MNAWFCGVPAGWSCGHTCLQLSPRQTDGRAPLSPWAGAYGAIDEALARDEAWGKAHGSTVDLDKDQPEGVARLAWRDGWSLVWLWDRSADRRGNCFVAFAFDCIAEPWEVRGLLCRFYPAVLMRIEQHIGRNIHCDPVIRGSALEGA